MAGRTTGPAGTGVRRAGHDEDGQIVGQVGLLGVGFDDPQNDARQFRRARLSVRVHHRLEPRFLERLPAAVFCFGDAVAVEHERVSRRHPGLVRLVLRVVEHAEGDAPARQVLEHAVAPAEERRHVAGVDVDEVAGRRVAGREEQRDEAGRG
jgi:hypothetical protein